LNQDQLSALIGKARSDGSDTLDLAKEDLEFLPREIGSLVDLVELDLSGNRLTALPPEVGPDWAYQA